MASAAVARRRGSKSARAARAAAKKRRQTIVAAVLGAFLVALLAYEVPHTLKLFHKRSSTAAAGVVATPSSAHAGRHETKLLHGGGSGLDPFAARSLPNRDPHVAAAGGPDPFTGPASSSLAAAPQSAPTVPNRIVIGQPGGHRVARHGWIVILASIPRGEGHGAAARFAAGARQNVGRLTILDSSRSRPLRSGYWVVYSGPYGTLAAVSRRAGDVHAAGYRTAYIRELITYR